MIEFERIDDIEQANFLLNTCFNTIEELNNKIDNEKNRVQKYRETNKKLRSKHIELRDYFAARAMQAMLAIPNCEKEVNVTLVCEHAYVFASAMMKARND